MDVNSWDYVLFSRRKEKRVVATEIQLVPRRRYLKQQRAECNLGKTNTMAHQSKHKTWQMINKDFPSFSFLLRFLHCWNSEKFIGRYKTNQFDKFLWKHFVSAVSRIRRKETFFSVRRSDSEWAAARRCRGGLNIWQERGWDLFLLWQDVGQRAVNTEHGYQQHCNTVVLRRGREAEKQVRTCGWLHRFPYQHKYHIIS